MSKDGMSKDSRYARNTESGCKVPNNAARDNDTCWDETTKGRFARLIHEFVMKKVLNGQWWVETATTKLVIQYLNCIELWW